MQKNSSEKRMLVEIAGLGALAGIRSLSAPAILARKMMSPGRLEKSLEVLAILEMVADKMPGIPRRTDQFPLTGRALTGSLIGLILGAQESERGAALGALVGGLSAFLATHLIVRLRETETGLGLPDFLAGLIEDGLVAWGAERYV
jgi:uncharacterized membrane protein